MEKTRTSINSEKISHSKNSQSNNGGKNSSANNKRKNVVIQKLDVMWEFMKSTMRSLLEGIHENFVNIAKSCFALFWFILFVESEIFGKFAAIELLLCLLLISFRKYYDKRKNDSTLDKLRQFKRFTHKTENGTVYIKEAEFEQSILYLYELEEFLKKPRE